MEVRNLGYHRGTSLPQRTQRNPAHGDGHHLLHHYTAENSVLHGELDFTHRPYFISLRPGVLLAGRSRRKSDIGYQHSPVTRCVPLARIQNFATDLARPPAHCQIPALHIHHEHGLNPGHCGHHQLELQVRCFTACHSK